jgi:hypothetical protein
MQSVDDQYPANTVRPLGSRPHQLRGSNPASSEASREPKGRTDVTAPAAGEEFGPGLTGGEPRSGEGAAPLGAPGGDGIAVALGRAILDELRGLRVDLRQSVGRALPSNARVEWTDLDAERAKRAQANPQLKSLRPLEIKTPNERALLERLSSNRGKKNDR